MVLCDKFMTLRNYLLTLNLQMGTQDGKIMYLWDYYDDYYQPFFISSKEIVKMQPFYAFYVKMTKPFLTILSYHL